MKIDDSIHEFFFRDSLADKIDAINAILQEAELFREVVQEKEPFKIRYLVTELVKHLRPYYLTHGESLNKLNLHLAALKLLYNINLASPSFHQSSEIINICFDMLLSLSNERHKNCCADSLTIPEWDKKQFDRVKRKIHGREFLGFFDEENGTCFTELYDPKTLNDVCSILDDGKCGVELQNLKATVRPQGDGKLVKVTDVVSTDCVWVQDVLGMKKVDNILSSLDLQEYSEPCIRKYLIGKLKDFTFRAVILEQKEVNKCRVFAIDYGWEMEIANSNLFISTSDLDGFPEQAKPCKLVNIRGATKWYELQINIVKLLQTFTNIPSCVFEILEDGRFYQIIYLLYTTRHSGLVFEILVLFSNLCQMKDVREHCSWLMMGAVINSIKNWLFFPEIVSLAFEVSRNLVSFGSRGKSSFVLKGGFSVATEVMSYYRANEEICLFENAFNTLRFCSASYKSLSKHIKLRGTIHHQSPLMSDMSHIFNYVPKNQNISFFRDILEGTNTSKFTIEILSFLNSTSGGEIFVGVSEFGIIHGIPMSEARKEVYTKIIYDVVDKRIIDYRLEKVPQNDSILDFKFSEVNNIHNRQLPASVRLYIISVTVKPYQCIQSHVPVEGRHWSSVFQTKK